MRCGGGRKAFSKLAMKSSKMQAFARGIAAGKTGTQAAIDAGYAPKYADRQASQLLGNPRVQEMLAELNHKTERATIADIIERREWWTEVMRNGQEPLKERLRASELLSKSLGDFIDTHAVTFDWSQIPTGQLETVYRGLAQAVGTNGTGGHRNGTS